ncbi:nucleoside monophosphate kinase [Patescibacteria group bacterium]|nr:nucleoside monophosphate kinase [Patescibacteria group bacterium]MDE1946886.1 nucleoside monophosphate kinase [Patescibacteria group bacterium]MDE2010706.1 nucleoside monophosphate kinase [Patescibacteria group bacterium]MDE2232688.1 nucleoside monophosphate kinase [Patescibacteria group bacterium]
MKPQTFIFIGRSGCGKGTQAALLDKALKKQTPKMPIVHLETGKLFRDFIQGKNYTHELSKKIYENGGLQPEFLTVHLWSDFFAENMKVDANLIIDGTPRKLAEARILHTAFEFYGRGRPKVILLNVSRKWSEDRMLERHRADDNKRDIKARLDWFDTEVAPTVEFFRNNSFYEFFDIDGERAIEAIHSDIVKTLDLR